MSVVKKGESWFVKLSGGRSVFRAKVIDITTKTALLADDDDLSFHYPPSRYLKNDVRFVEKTVEWKWGEQ